LGVIFLKVPIFTSFNSGFTFSCSIEDDLDIYNDQLNNQEYSTGGEDEQIKTPPPPPPIILP
jgi:hypothetical protein